VQLGEKGRAKRLERVWAASRLNIEKDNRIDILHASGCRCKGKKNFFIVPGFATLDSAILFAVAMWRCEAFTHKNRQEKHKRAEPEVVTISKKEHERKSPKRANRFAIAEETNVASLCPGVLGLRLGAAIQGKERGGGEKTDRREGSIHFQGKTMIF